MNKKISILVHLAVPLFVLHLCEEVKNNFYNTDTSIGAISHAIHLSPETTYFLIQIPLFIFLGILLIFILSKKLTPSFLLIVFNIVLLYEFSHTYEAIHVGGYSPGVITGTILGMLGIILLGILLPFKKKERRV